MVLLLGIAMGLCVVLSLVVPPEGGHDGGLELGGWVISLSVALGLGTILWTVGWILRKKKVENQVMRQREAIALVGVGWVTCSIVASLPYILCAPYVSFSFALFEGVSGLSTTGASIFPDIASLPPSILIWRSLTEWVGGMGILAMFVVILSGASVSSKTLIGTESSMSNSDLSSLRQTMRLLWLLYFGFTLVCGIGLKLLGMSTFQALNHALTCVSTGGFSTENSSITEFSTPIKAWIILFMVLGAITFPFYLALKRMKFAELRQRFEEVWWFLGILFLVCLTLILERSFGQLNESVINICFNVTSFFTSTGYYSGDYNSWTRLATGFLILFMITGGCSGSTAGGLKLSRIILWWRYIQRGIQQTFRPKLVLPIKLNDRTVPDTAFGQLFLVLTLFGFFAITGTIVLQLLEPGQTLMASLSTVISCLGNIGPVFGEMSAADGFANTTSASKFLFIILMILGRLEYIALLVLFTRQLWKKY